MVKSTLIVWEDLGSSPMNDNCEIILICAFFVNIFEGET